MSNNFFILVSVSMYTPVAILISSYTVIKLFIYFPICAIKTTSTELKIPRRIRSHVFHSLIVKCSKGHLTEGTYHNTYGLLAKYYSSTAPPLLFKPDLWITWPFSPSLLPTPYPSSFGESAQHARPQNVKWKGKMKGWEIWVGGRLVNMRG